ncbi:zinc finger protein [Loa loa]|uniref:Zinc finger protein n=1 Tax=Loa loa TaxID=7209 RepID=A0A1S0TSJ9_LOALO|nr:zinc finger protein [Loa loa]EFO19402.1 zinc finger protein [Loa loa]
MQHITTREYFRKYTKRCAKFSRKENSLPSLCRMYFAHEQYQGINRTKENARRTIYLRIQRTQLWANIQLWNIIQVSQEKTSTYYSIRKV